MSLIRCLGPLKMPATYRSFFNQEADIYRRKRLYDPSMTNPWEQNHFLPDGFDSSTKSHELRGHIFKTKVPVQCEKLTARLAELFKGKQSHVGMTLVSTPIHADRFIEQNATVLFIPFQVSKCHFLQVEDEVRQLKANHIYAFSQLRPHGLIYQGPREENSGSTPCSALSVSFKKLRI